MCGLVGVAGKISLKEERVFKLMLQLDVIRGAHSTGVMSSNDKGQTSWVKKEGVPQELFKDKNFIDMFRGSHSVLMGHNRYATKGVVNHRNAHPFEHGDLIGCHNGTIRGQHLLDDHFKFIVDSDNIYHHMNKLGVNDTISKLDGAYALTWYDKSTNNMCFIRNWERELYFSYSKDKKTLFWASEPWMIEVGCGKVGIDITDPAMFTEECKYEFHIGSGAPGLRDPLNAPRVKQMEVYVRPQKKFYGSYSGGHFPKNQKALPQKSAEIKDFQKEAELRKLIGKEITFLVDGTVESSTVNYLYGKTVDTETQVRVHCKHLSDLWSLLKDSMHNCDVYQFTAKCKAVQTSLSTYLLVDNRTILPVDEEDHINDYECFPVNEGILVSIEDFKKKTHQGCAFCTDPVFPEQADDILWINSSDFFCPDCKELEEAKPFIETTH